MQGGDPFTSIGIKVDVMVFLIRIGLINTYEHEEMFDLQKTQ
jgi:hypothetical protein